MRPLYKLLIVSILVTTMAVAASGCTTSTTSTNQLTLATTTSLYDTGLLDYLKPFFEQQYNASLLITSQGSGKALEVASRGDADVLAVHSPAAEKAFVANGTGMNRRCFAYNYFVIVGPKNDPAAINGTSAVPAFQKIYQLGTNNTTGVTFVSRGDQSGTHVKEQGVWASAGYNYTTQVEKSGAWYVETGSGMGATLQIADQKQAYTLSDLGTFLAYKGNLSLVTLGVTNDSALLNVYSAITVYNTKFTTQEIQLANNFVNFMISNSTQQLIGAYGVQQYGQPLFYPMNGNCSQFNCTCTGLATDLVPPTLVTSTANATTTGAVASTATISATTTSATTKAAA
ncbi:MAG: substrate-binding domain-containing protein [Halobacteriota archaeon]